MAGRAGLVLGRLRGWINRKAGKRSPKARNSNHFPSCRLPVFPHPLMRFFCRNGAVAVDGSDVSAAHLAASGRSRALVCRARCAAWLRRRAPNAAVAARSLRAHDEARAAKRRRVPPTIATRPTKTRARAPDDKPLAPALEHRVVAGETLSAIANHYGVTLEQILAAQNPELDPDRIRIGQTLAIGGGAAARARRRCSRATRSPASPRRTASRSPS